MKHVSHGTTAAVTHLTARVACIPSAGDSPSSQLQPVQAESRPVQPLTLILEGITAEDYMAWVRDPEPPALGRTLKGLTTRAEPLGDRLDVELVWDREPPPPRDAAVTAGFLLTPEVVGLRG